MKKGKKILGIRADWKALTFCIVAACTFWLLNALNQDYTDSISYPFRIEYDPSQIVPIQNPPEKIKLNVTGYGWVLLRKSLGINAKPIVYRAEKSSATGFLTSEELVPVISRQLSDLQLNFLITDTVFVRFDDLKTKKVKVVLDSSSLPLAASYRLVSPVIVSPDSLTFQGPASLIKAVPDSIKINVTGDNLKGEYEETIKIPESLFDLRVKMLNKEVTVRFTSARFDKESIVLPLNPVNFPVDTSLTTFDPTIILTYYVKEEDKGKIKAEDFKVNLNFRRMDKKDSTIIPSLVKKPVFIIDQYFTPYAIRVRKK